MIRIKELCLREFGDQGAETLERYFAQIAYTAFWCIRMLYSHEGIEAVIPEGYEDVVVIRKGVYELHQVKTRQESRGPWSMSEVLAILCQQYNRRSFFPSACLFHFVSNQMADNKAQKPNTLYRLKLLLDIEHSGDRYTEGEKEDLKLIERRLVPQIRQILLQEYTDEVDDATALELLHRTWIDTDCSVIRNPNHVIELEAALAASCPGIHPYNLPQLQDIYDRLILLIVRKIITTLTFHARYLRTDDILSCRSKVMNALENGYKKLDQVPGDTILDKKAILAGFDLTELPRFHRQKALAEATRRKYVTLNMENELERLISAILDCHWECRNTVCRIRGIEQCPGPHILSLIMAKLEEIVVRTFPQSDVDSSFCMGLLWKQTDLCAAWWDGFESTA
jgi:hypothetical protein